MVKAPNPNLLLVEGRDDQFVIAEVFERATGIEWEPRKKQFIVEIEWCGSDVDVLSRLGIKWKESGRNIVGLVIDADSSGTRWEQVCSHAPAEVRPDLPDELPADGLVLDLKRGRRFGVWIMPDNRSSGMMETFLMQLRTSMPQELGVHVISSMKHAQDLMKHHAKIHPDQTPPVRPWKDIHADKAELHTWLAWQDTPGLQLHEAVMKQLLDVHAPLAQSFVGWMKRLYGYK